MKIIKNNKKHKKTTNRHQIMLQPLKKF